jgi:hypothetical protein
MNIIVTLTVSLNLNVNVHTLDSLTDEKFTDTHSKVLTVAESFNTSGVQQHNMTDSLLHWLPATSIYNEFHIHDYLLFNEFNYSRFTTNSNKSYCAKIFEEVMK